MKSWLPNTLLTAASIVASLVASEGVARIYVYGVAKQGKLFRPDAVLGWVVLPNLDLERRTGTATWRIVTDSLGFRGRSAWEGDEKRRVLIAGDSYSFGEGVDLAARYDSYLVDAGTSVVNLGVMGYGTDQQALVSRKWVSSLRPGDVLLVQTYGNDFHDLSRKRHSGRSKPWFALENGLLTPHFPHIGAVEILRDRSYVFSRFATIFHRDSPEELTEPLLRSGELYQRLLLDELAGAMNRGARLLIAHHGDTLFDVPFSVEAVFESVCRHVSGCLSLDPLIPPGDPNFFLSDGHWTPEGHRVAGLAIKALIDRTSGVQE